MRFEATIEMGNDAMLTGEDLAGALRRIAKRLADEYQGEATGPCRGAIMDLNGNRAGSWVIEGE